VASLSATFLGGRLGPVLGKIARVSDGEFPSMPDLLSSLKMQALNERNGVYQPSSSAAGSGTGQRTQNFPQNQTKDGRSDRIRISDGRVSMFATNA
jgi:hypothetical protein